MVAKPAEPSIGNWLNDHTSPIASNAQRVGTWLTIKPVTTADSENSRKKLDPKSPN